MRKEGWRGNRGRRKRKEREGTDLRENGAKELMKEEGIDKIENEVNQEEKRNEGEGTDNITNGVEEGEGRRKKRDQSR